jgi:predicted short-subunit dehydrogenase-like oxidoreductase (DUF2520 family)
VEQETKSQGDRPRQLLAGLTFSLAGPGRVGSSLAHWLVAGGARLAAAAGRRRSPAAAELTRRLGGEACAVGELDSGGHDLLLLAVPDPVLPEVAEQLGRREVAAVALHTSGSRGAEVLAPLTAAGAATGSLHPLKAFPRTLADPRHAQGLFFAVDGAPAALELARRLSRCWGARAVAVAAAARPLYHLAATLAAGGVVTLVATAAELARRLGLPAEVSRAYLELARGALDAAADAAAPADAITGPVARGDLATTRAQLELLARQDRETAALVAHLGQASLRRLAERQPLAEGQAELLAELARRAHDFS